MKDIERTNRDHPAATSSGEGWDVRLAQPEESRSGKHPYLPQELLAGLCQKASSVTHLKFKVNQFSPVSLIRELGLEGGGPFILLDSAGGNPELCRYSFLAWAPRLAVRIKSGVAMLFSGDRKREIRVADPFSLLRELLKLLTPAERPDTTDALLWGGAFGLVSYDAGRYIERLPSMAADDLELPELDFIFPRRLICFDHARREAHLFFEDASDAEMEAAASAIRGQQSQTEPPASSANIEPRAFNLSSATKSNMNSEGFKRMVRRAREYIVAGDTFQSNLSQRLELAYSGDSLDLYAALRLINPSPFAGYLDMGSYQIISSSPERLVQLNGRNAQTRPIAGTRRRGVDFTEDASLKLELNLDPKERAEHIMLVDLERNDLGRVCDYGSVQVDELMTNEAYSHVIHIVSNVKGALHEKKDSLDLLKAMFPGGTITGCPKVRCMEIIDELEPVRRGPYTGSFGYIGYNVIMDMNIVIRSLVRLGDMVYAQVGAGIVADSDPEREYHETLRKAEAMVWAVELAKNGLLLSS